MKNCKGTFVTARQPTAEQACLGILGMQMASAAHFVFNNMNMFSDAVSDEDFEKWLEDKPWVK